MTRRDKKTDHLLPAVKRRLAQAVLDGVTGADIADRFGLNYQQTTEVLAELGIERPVYVDPHPQPKRTRAEQRAAFKRSLEW